MGCLVVVESEVKNGILFSFCFSRTVLFLLFLVFHDNSISLSTSIQHSFHSSVTLLCVGVLFSQWSQKKLSLIISVKEETISKELLCSICLHPFVDPVEHPVCGNEFCKHCGLEEELG